MGGIAGNEYQSLDQEIRARDNAAELRRLITSVVSRNSFAVGTITYTAAASVDPRYSHIIANSGSTVALTLPYANYWGSTRSPMMLFTNIGTATITITASGSDTIDGAATYSLLSGQRAILISNGSTAWYAISIDYEIGAWTPVLTFATPGDLAVTYSVQRGTYTKVGRSITADFTITTSTFTHTTAAGGVRITGLPFTIASDDANYIITGSVAWQGITKAGYTQVNPQAASGNTYLTMLASGSGVAFAGVTAADMPTTGTVAFRGSITYRTS